MALKGLQKTDKRRDINPDELERVLSGSDMRTNNPASATEKEHMRSPKSRVIFERYTFSLTKKVSDDIDDLCLTTKKINRSDVIKAGVIALQRMAKDERKRVMDQMKSIT